MNIHDQSMVSIILGSAAVWFNFKKTSIMTIVSTFFVLVINKPSIVTYSTVFSVLGVVIEPERLILFDFYFKQANIPTI